MQAGRHACQLLQCIGGMGSGDLGGEELGRMLASLANIDFATMSPPERAALVHVRVFGFFFGFGVSLCGGAGCGI